MLYNLRSIREQNELTQEELANAANINRVTIARYETLKVDPTIENAEKIAEVLGVTVNDLIKKKVG